MSLEYAKDWESTEHIPRSKQKCSEITPIASHLNFKHLQDSFNRERTEETNLHLSVRQTKDCPLSEAHRKVSVGEQ